MKIIDIFSGAGGLAIGWKMAYGETVDFVAALDADPSLQPVFRHNFPNTRFVLHRFGNPFVQNEAKLVYSLLGEPRGIDVLLAGPPCQALSPAGKRIDHEDRALALHVADLCELMRPKIVLIENVPELARVWDGRLLGRLQVQLGHIGYVSDFRVLRAAEFGVPQFRSRCFVIALRTDLFGARFEQIFANLRPSNNVEASGESRSRSQTSFLDSLPAPITAEAAIGDMPSLSAGEGVEEGLLSCEPLNQYQAYLRDPSNKLFNHMAVKHSHNIVELLSRLAPGESPQAIPNHPLRRKEYFRAAYARLKPDSPAPTITTQTHNPGSGRFTHYRDHRVITVREAARLQSFPDNFQFFGSQASQRRHVGNAVPPLLTKAIANSLRELLEHWV